MTRPNKFKTPKPGKRGTPTKSPNASKILPSKPLLSDATKSEKSPHVKRKTTKYQWADGDYMPQFAPSVDTTPSTTTATTAQIAARPLTQPEPTVKPPELSTSLFPSEIDALRVKYTLHTHIITSSSKMHTKVTQILSQLDSTPPSEPPPPDQKPIIVALSAKGGAGTKLIGVIEVVKREMDTRGWRWWQYCGVHGIVEEKKNQNKVQGKKRSLETETKGGDEEDDEEEAFENMMMSREESQKIRQAPVITIYISRAPVPELRARFGEQASKVEST